MPQNDKATAPTSSAPAAKKSGTKGGANKLENEPALPALQRDPIMPLLGHDVDYLRTTLSGSERPITTQDFMFEVGLQRTRFTQIKQLGSKPILKPRLEIPIRVIEEFPQFSFIQAEYLPETILQLMDQVRPDRKHTMRYLSILLGYEMSSHLPWGEGKKMLPTPKRTLRLLYQGLTQPDPKDCLDFLNAFEQIVVAVAAGHGISHHDLARGGFSGYRKFRAETWADTDAAEAVTLDDD